MDSGRVEHVRDIGGDVGDVGLGAERFREPGEVAEPLLGDTVEGRIGRESVVLVVGDDGIAQRGDPLEQAAVMALPVGMERCRLERAVAAQNAEELGLGRFATRLGEDDVGVCGDDTERVRRE